MNIELIKNRLKKTLAVSGVFLALAMGAPAFAQLPGEATTEHPDKQDGAHMIMVTTGGAPDGGIGTTSSGSMPLIRNGP
jgi:hypothetical protein